MTDETQAAGPIELVIVDLDNAETVPPRAPDPDPEDADQAPPDSVDPAASVDLPPGCPVSPLGIKGDLAFYLDASRQLRELKFGRHNRLEITGLFGAKNDLPYDYWPRKKWVSDGDEDDPDAGRWMTIGVHWEKAAESLLAASHRKGVWDPTDRVRGAGAWRGPNGELILHCGDAILTGPRPGAAKGIGDKVQGEWGRPGASGRYVFPAAPTTIKPHPLRTPLGADGPAFELLDLLKTWRWRRGELDAVLLLGWIGAAMLGGALHWRPVAWITGGAGTGKSTLHELLRRVFDESLISASDASAAGLWQKVRYATLPIALDELESEEDNRKAQNVIKLARQAASGGVVLRGGSDHDGSEFMARSCFLFSSILHPPLLGQDHSRIALLQLSRFGQGDVSPTLDADYLRDLGRHLLRCLVDHWPKFEHVLATYRAELQERQHNARGADVFGTLLACAHVMLYGAELDPDVVDAWCAKLEAASAEDGEAIERDEVLMIKRVLSYAVDPYRNGARSLLGEWIEKAAGLSSDPGTDAPEANKIIQSYGLKVQHDKERRVWVAIANYHAGLDQVFKGTHWAGRSGTLGVWVQAAQRLEGAMRAPKPLYFAGAGVVRCILLPLKTVCEHAEFNALGGYLGHRHATDDDDDGLVPP